MKAYRYMSMKEFTKMSSGCSMTNLSTFNNCRTNSVGFCFLPEEVLCIRFEDSYTMSPEEALAFLRGIVSDDVLVEFEAPEECFQKSEGIYADPFGDYYDRILVEELCASEYDRDKFVPLRYAMVCYDGVTWYTFN